MTLPASTRGLNSRRPRPAQAHWDPSHLCRPRPAQAHWDPSHLCRPRPAQAHWDPSHLCRPRPAQAHWDPSHLCRPRPSHLCRLRLRKPRLLPAPLTPIKPGESAPGPLSSGDAGRECCGSVCRSAARRSGSGAAAAWSPRCSARGCSQQAAEMLQPGQTPPTAQKDPKEPLALPGMEAQAVYRGPQTAVPVSDLPELPHSCQILDPKQYALEMP
ncbi:uncharacterized protein GJ701_006080 isoform 7-T13 [Geothlypis trichas]